MSLLKKGGGGSPEKGGKGGSISSFFTFRSFATPGCISAVYLLGIVFIVAFGVEAILWGVNAKDPELLLIGVAILVAGNIAWRILCELMVVFFRLHDRLLSIDLTMKNIESGMYAPEDPVPPGDDASTTGSTE
jgi:hypothetical protein